MRAGRLCLGLAAVSAAALCGAAETLQRSAVSSASGRASGSGQSVEVSVGQMASLGFTQANHRVYSGHLNTNHSPGTITTITAVTGAGEGEVDLTWTAPGADGAVNTAAAYVLRFSTNAIANQTLFEAANTRTIPNPQAPGSVESYTLTGLAPNSTYYVAIEARDAAKNQGALSNLVGNSTVTLAVPPADVADLAAGTGAGGGELLLTWTSPGDDGAVGNLNPGQFRIDLSTDPGHAFFATEYQVLIATLATAGSAQAYAAGGLIGNSTYYVGLFTGDDIPVFSGVSNVAVALTRAFAPGAAAYSAVSSTTFTANWTLNGNRSGTEFFVEVSTLADYSVLLATQDWSAALSAVFSGLTVNVPYHARVKARSAALQETAFTDLGALTLSPDVQPPLGIQIAVRDRALFLSWNPVFSGNPDGINIYRAAAAGGPYSLLASVPIGQASYTDTGLQNGTAYFYRLSAFRTGAESAQSAAVSGIPADSIAPQGLERLRGRLNGGSYELSWAANPFNADGTAMSDLAGYRVYRTIDFDAAPILVGTLGAGTLAFNDVQGASAAPSWYFVRAVDTSGNESIDSPWSQSPDPLAPQTGRTPIEYSYLVSPDRKGFFRVRSDVWADNGMVVTWRHFSEEENGRTVASYEVVPLFSNGALAPASFKFPNRTELTFRYTPPPSGAAAGALAPNTAFQPKDLALFHFNGVEYVKVGGNVDTSNNTISAVTRLTGKYIVKQTLRATSFIVVQTAPRKIFTPNGDGVNDTFNIYFENPNDTAVSFAKVFDLTGAEVADLQLGQTGNSLSWDGRGRGGDVARGGVYVYQIQAEGRTWNGTIVVAK
jgi:hypothetical protein